MSTRDTPLTDARVRRVRIENEDSCCAIYVKVDEVPYEGDLVDADFARSLETRLNAAEELLRKLVRVADIMDLYLGAPCFNKHPVPDDRVVLYVEHGSDSVEITLGECRAIRAHLANAANPASATKETTT